MFCTRREEKRTSNTQNQFVVKEKDMNKKNHIQSNTNAMNR